MRSNRVAKAIDRYTFFLYAATFAVVCTMLEPTSVPTLDVDIGRQALNKYSLPFLFVAQKHLSIHPLCAPLYSFCQRVSVCVVCVRSFFLFFFLLSLYLNCAQLKRPQHKHFYTSSRHLKHEFMNRVRFSCVWSRWLSHSFRFVMLRMRIAHCWRKLLQQQ